MDRPIPLFDKAQEENIMQAVSQPIHAFPAQPIITAVAPSIRTVAMSLLVDRVLAA
ncbi:hypothetical protein VSR82_12885 [Burkholderia sp. JPY481]|uniref:hypothetical protein n=1 Tax=Paraburkholderia sp. BR14264 TaxID=3237001 RepID=UPI003175E2AD